MLNWLHLFGQTVQVTEYQVIVVQANIVHQFRCLQSCGSQSLHDLYLYLVAIIDQFINQFIQDNFPLNWSHVVLGV